MKPIVEMRFMHFIPAENKEIYAVGLLRFVRMPLAVVGTVGRRFA